MRRTLGLAFAVSLFVVSAASADIPLPKDLKHVDPVVRFDGVEKHPGQVFFLRFLTFTGSPAGIPHRLIEVKDGKPFALNAQRRLGDVKLLAVERKEFEKRAKEDGSLKWLTDKTAGILVANVPGPSTVAKAALKEVPVTAYQVAIKDGKLTVTKEALEGKSGGAGSPLLPLWAFGLLGAFAVAGFGVWVARRGRNPV